MEEKQTNHEKEILKAIIENIKQAQEKDFSVPAQAIALALAAELAVEQEYLAKKAVNIAERKLSKAKTAAILAAYETGTIDQKMKVAQIKQLEEQAVELDTGVKVAREELQIEQDSLNAVQAEKCYHETVLSLTKAWLYSKSGGAGW